ncbi:DUF5692 family protein [Arcanobacterium buesumense]|uniref:Uncharacterized protein n=1 Tax=Arcanobacterium buesumense TaxID=2722751 RepID=A0A6H2EKX5_9ACTO|nr:DUF5692 family protein [Arcanobacterium buesumense]QJC21352.1 hypothetical protein HC352_01655 [Arcanobacterium buesumense]
MFTSIPTPEYPVLFAFEVGEWWDYLMLIIVTAALAITAWLAQRNKWVVLAVFIVAPILLTIFWWPYSTAGTASAGWFPIVKQYSALAGSLCLVALQYSQRLRHNQWYLLIPPVILAINILEAVIRDFQCANIQGLDPETGLTISGGIWNYMNGVAGILNLLAISGWVGIFVANNKSKAIMWGDLTLGWIIAYDLWNFAYVYNCLSDRAWYSGLALLASCTVPALFPSLRGSWIQFRAYTLTLWSAVVLTFPHFMHDSMFAHRSSYNSTALFLFSFLALVVNIAVFGYHFYRIFTLKRNPFKVEVYSDTPEYVRMVRKNASDEEKERIAGRLGKTPEQLGYRRTSKRPKGLRTKR